MLLVLQCSSKPDPTKETHLISHNGCWYETKHLAGSIQYGSGQVVDRYETVWEARCREDYLERVKRAGCKLVSVSPSTVAATGCRDFIGVVNY